MTGQEQLTIGIALIPRASARSWQLVEALLELTLRSVVAQTDQDFRVVLVGHERPRVLPHDARFTFLQADWPAQPPGPDNEDSGRKKSVIGEFVLAQGGGLLTLLDADDWLDVRFVEAARATMAPDRIGALVETGFAIDLQSLRAARLPHRQAFDRPFHRLCGSSTVARLRPAEPDALRRDPCQVLGSHHQWVDSARAHGTTLPRLPVSGGYLINTSENHSEVHGPYADWREAFTAAVNREGAAIDDAFAARFGLTLDQICRVSERFFPHSPAGSRARARGRPLDVGSSRR
jgi:Putative rhamnosyl transferase